jgi:hypothetical protein
VATRTTIIDMVWCLLAEAQAAHRWASQAITCSFTRAVYAHVPSFRRKVEKDLTHQPIGAAERRSKSTEPLIRDCAQRSDEGDRSAAPPPGLYTNHMVADGRTHTRMLAHPAHTEPLSTGPSGTPNSERQTEHAQARATLHSLACTVCTPHSKGACPNTQRSTLSRCSSLAPQLQADAELRSDHPVRACTPARAHAP